MKQAITLFYSFLLTHACICAQKQVTLEDIWVNGTYSAKGVEGFNFTADGVHYIRQEGKKLKEYSLVTGKETRTIFDDAQVKDLPDYDGFELSADGNKILFAANTESIYRWSTRANYFMVSSQGGVAVEILPKAKIMYATFSPDGSKVAFVYENNLYYRNLVNNELVQITKDGEKNAILNGAGDWVYEEEFELSRAYEWSPDSKSIAFVRLDERAVPEFSLEKYDIKAPYPTQVTFKYPKVGEKNSTASVFIYDTPSANLTSVQTLNPEYIARLGWSPDNQLTLVSLNRLQNHLQILLCDRNNGKSKVILSEKSTTYIELLENMVWTEGGKSFLWMSEKDGFRQIFLYNADGTLRQKITTEAYDITDFYGINEAQQTIYYQAAACNALDREVYAHQLKTKKCKRLSPKKGTNMATFSPNMAYFSLRHATINSPSEYSLHTQTGDLVRTLEDNSALKARMLETARVDAEFFDFKLPSGQKLNGFIMKPRKVTKDAPKLPLLMYVYGGPGSQQVLNDWKGSNYWWFQHLVEQGYAVACVDNRGTGARGTAFRSVTYGQLGKIETEDQIAAAKYLGKQTDIDKDRIGIFGWSYGGYMSSRCLFEGNDVFKAAISVAPVTNWKWYDSVYTERYMGLYKDNQKGYDDNAPIAFADRLKGQYLLIHGLADDNVHFQHTAELANALISNGKQYQTMIYPNKNHSIGGKETRLHLYTLMTQFLDKKLKPKTAF
jgi:dipeptidyl-peptidase 4